MMSVSSPLRSPDRWGGGGGGCAPAAARFDATGPEDYSLYDESGRRLGTISAAGQQPIVGSHAPTFYLQRAPAPQQADGA